MVRVEDPLGFLIDFFDRSEHPERLQQRYDLRRGAEVARFDHFNICVPDVPRAYDYYSGLGFGLSETIEDGQTLYAAWMYRKQTVHDMAFTGGAGPRLHHLGFFAHEAHAVLRMCDILGSLSLESHIERGPGRHGVSNAFYVYLRDPDGHRLEIYTSDYYTGDPDHPVLRWSVQDPRRRDFWACRHPVVVHRGVRRSRPRRPRSSGDRDRAAGRIGGASRRRRLHRSRGVGGIARRPQTPKPL